MIEFQTKIDKVERFPGSGFVERVRFIVTGTDQATGEKQDCQGSVLFQPVPDVDLVPFDDLTAAQVLAWIAEAPEVEHAKAMITRSLTDTSDPVAELVAPPWET